MLSPWLEISGTAELLGSWSERAGVDLVAHGTSSDAETIRAKRPLQAIEGEVPDTINLPRGCRFYGRCNRVTDAVRERCAHAQPPLAEVAPGHKTRCWLKAA